VLKFADTAIHETISAGLSEILRNAQAYFQTFNTHDEFVLVISNAKVNPGNRLEFQPTFMEPREERGENTGREVAILVFPGLFKVRQDTRVCMVKSKVLCRDDPGLQDLV